MVKLRILVLVIGNGMLLSVAGALSKRNMDTSIGDYQTKRTCWWNESCKKEFQLQFECRCPRWSYCRGPGRYYNAYCSVTATGYVWQQRDTDYDQQFNIKNTIN